MTPLEQRQQKKKKLSVKQSGTHCMAAGKAVTRPIRKGALYKWPVPMNQKLKPLVQQHATGDGNDQRDQGRPQSFPGKKQYQRKQNDCDPLTRTELCQRVQYCDERRSQTLMESCGNTVIGSPKRIPNR